MLYFMDISTLVKVTSRAWSLNILALMYAGTPGRQSTLLAASGAGRTAFRHSLDHLINLDMLERNPGHGHPLRPEYRLTQKGAEIASIADRIKRTALRTPQRNLLQRVWTIPILAVSQKPRHFIEIKRELAPITDRALSQSLKELQLQRWVRRKVDIGSRPPRALYQAANIGAQIGQAVKN